MSILDFCTIMWPGKNGLMAIKTVIVWLQCYLSQNLQGLTGLTHGQEIKKSQEKIRKMTKVRKKWEFLKKGKKIFFKSSNFASSN